MKKICYLLVLFLSSFSVMATDFFDSFNADKINSTTYVIHGPREVPNPENRGFMNNPAFIIADKSVVIVDPGSSQEAGAMVLREIKKVTDKPVSHIFNTHVHGDHWLGNDIIQQSYPGVVIIADPRMIKKAKAGAAQSWIENMIDMTDGATKETKIAYPNMDVTDGKQLKIAGLTFNIHSVGIGHSDSDIMIEYVEESTFFTGDNVAYLRVLRMDDGSFRDNIKALDRAISLNSKHYVPGHGPSGDVKLVKLQREFFDILYTQVEKYTEEGLEDFEMKPKVVAMLAKFKDWAGFDEELGKQISVAKLEVEQAEFE